MLVLRAIGFALRFAITYGVILLILFTLIGIATVIVMTLAALVLENAAGVPPDSLVWPGRGSNPDDLSVSEF
jgi:hypothetical protein